MKTYFERLSSAAANVRQVLEAKGVCAKRLNFGGEGALDPKKPRVPTDANSMFLGNRALGDWAETRLAVCIDESKAEFQAIHYGDSDRIAAGDPGFKSHYLAELAATRTYGKRPDLLIYPHLESPAKDRFTGMQVADTFVIARSATAAIEVRSSKFKALRYMSVREQEKREGKKVDREAPSFTVKVEDLIIVYRWMERFGVPQSYVQVFLDSIFGINFLSLFEIIGSGAGFKIEKPRASQNKTTIMVPITAGSRLATCTSPPDFVAEIRETRLGRVDSFVAPTGGTFELDLAEFEKVVLMRR